jgi:putative endonuclease
MTYYVYLLASRKGGALYIGVTNDLVRRIYEHRSKAAASFTSRYNVTKLVWFEIYDDPISAISQEKEIKKWRRAWKVALIERDNPDWKDCTAASHNNIGIPGSLACGERPGMTTATYPAAFSSRSAAARASAVISAPASIRAISSRR